MSIPNNFTLEDILKDSTLDYTIKINIEKELKKKLIDKMNEMELELTQTRHDLELMSKKVLIRDDFIEKLLDY